MRKVPSVDEADDGVPADVGPDDDDDEVEEPETVAVVLDELRPPGRQISSPNLGRGKDMGRSVNRAGLSLLRGSVGNSSFSSHNGVPGRLPLVLPSVGPFRAVTVVLLRSTSQGIIRGCDECDLQSPELSVESRDTRLLGRVLAGCEVPHALPELFVLLFLPPVSRLGVNDEVPRVEDAVVTDDRVCC